MGDIVGDNGNGSPSPGVDNGFEVGRLNNIEPREFAAVGDVGGGHAINNNHFDVAVMNNVGHTEFINDSCVIPVLQPKLKFCVGISTVIT